MNHATMDFGEHADWLRASARSGAARYARLAEQLTAAEDKLVADLGCGAGGMAVALAKQLPNATVMALDSNATVLDLARSFAAEHGANVTFSLADMDSGAPALTAALGGAPDLVWAAHAVHHALDQQAALTAIAEVLAPGGRLAIAEGGLAVRNLPWDVGVGQPGLQARLDVAGDRRLIAENVERGAVAMAYGWEQALRQAGLPHVEKFNDVIDRPVPLTGSDLNATLRSLSARADSCSGFLEPEDRGAWKVLLDPGHPSWLGHRDDLYHLEIRTVYIGHRA